MQKTTPINKIAFERKPLIPLDMIQVQSDIVYMKGKLDNLESTMTSKFTTIDNKFAAIDRRFAEIDARFVRIEKKLDMLEIRISRIETRLDEINEKLEKLLKLHDYIDKFVKEVLENREFQTIYSYRIENHEERISALELRDGDKKNPYKPTKP